MTTAHKLRVVHERDDQDPETLGALQRGADPADPTEHDTDVADWRAETIATQWEPENQLVGALMWLPAAWVRRILELVPDTAIWRPMNRWAYVMYSRTLCCSPTRLALEALFRRWSALAANSRIKALRSPCALNGTETMRMSPAMVLDGDRYHGVATHLAGECVGRTTDRTIDLARTNLDDWGAAIYEARGKLLAHLREVLHTLAAGASELAELRAGGVCDAEFADGRDGSDIDRFLDDAVRAVRASVAIAHTVIDKEAPR